MTAEREGRDDKNAERDYYMALQSYLDNGGVPPHGWTLLAISHSLGIGKDTGYYGVAYQNIEHPEQIIIAHRGTELDDSKDLLTADRQILHHAVPMDQYQDAMSFAAAISELGEVPVSAISQVGHSLGGNLASLVAISTDGRASTFNAPGEKEQLAQLEIVNGVPAGTYQNADYSEKIVAHVTQGDIVSGHGAPVGAVEQIDNPSLHDQTEKQERQYEIITTLLENVPHDDTRPIQELADIVLGYQIAKDAIDNHSAAYGHALLQDATAQDRMGPIYGIPTVEQAAGHIPSKAEWTVGDGVHSLESHLNPQPADAAQPNAQTPLHDMFAATTDHSMENKAHPTEVTDDPVNQSAMSPELQWPEIHSWDTVPQQMQPANDAVTPPEAPLQFVENIAAAIHQPVQEVVHSDKIPDVAPDQPTAMPAPQWPEIQSWATGSAAPIDSHGPEQPREVTMEWPDIGVGTAQFQGLVDPQQQEAASQHESKHDILGAFGSITDVLGHHTAEQSATPPENHSGGIMEFWGSIGSLTQIENPFSHHAQQEPTREEPQDGWGSQVQSAFQHMLTGREEDTLSHDRDTPASSWVEQVAPHGHSQQQTSWVDHVTHQDSSSEHDTSHHNDPSDHYSDHGSSDTGPSL